MHMMNTEELSTNWDNQGHIDAVRKLLKQFACELECRGIDHDRSKLEHPEVQVFARYISRLEDTTYGSEEYDQLLGEMKGALGHHYAGGRHHPEFHDEGVDGMTLVDLVEMLCDWIAATKRHKDGDILNSVEVNTERFGISDQLRRIFLNTIREYRQWA